MFKIESKIPLPMEGKLRYQGIAYDGCYFYLTVCNGRMIERFDDCFERKECFSTKRCYTYLCYDTKDACFWALEGKNPTIVFKLNECMEEVNCIEIPQILGGDPTGLTYNCCDDTLVLSFSSGILGVDKYDTASCKIIWENCREQIIGIESVCPYYICQCIREKRRFIRILSHCQKNFRDICISLEAPIQAAVFFPGNRDSLHVQFKALVTESGGQSYILHYVMECIGLYGPIADCNYKICSQDCNGDSYYPSDCNGGCDSGCNQDCNFNGDCCGYCTREMNINGILKSIARVEESIAHILNAEGEKLQKVIACSDNICEILEVNRAVNQTITSVTHLELALVEKLEKALAGETCD